MKTVAKKSMYEAMFLIDSALAASDWDGINKAIEKILKKAKADILFSKKWDERKLAYDIRGKSRGTYILTYFKAAGDKIHQIERAVQLSEKIMRVLILNADHLTKEDIEKQTSAALAEKQQVQQPETEAEKSQEQEKLKIEEFEKEDTDSSYEQEDTGEQEKVEETMWPQEDEKEQEPE